MVGNQAEMTLNTAKPNLADKPSIWPNDPSQYQSRDDLHTTTQNMAA